MPPEDGDPANEPFDKEEYERWEAQRNAALAKEAADAIPNLSDSQRTDLASRIEGGLDKLRGKTWKQL